MLYVRTKRSIACSSEVWGGAGGGVGDAALGMGSGLGTGRTGAGPSRGGGRGKCGIEPVRMNGCKKSVKNGSQTPTRLGDNQASCNLLYFVAGFELVSRNRWTLAYAMQELLAASASLVNRGFRRPTKSWKV